MLSVLININNLIIEEVRGETIVKDGNTYILHQPIDVYGNSEFIELAEMDGWEGDGTMNDPWIIENYAIDGGDYRYCIKISTVSHYFIIQNCYLFNASGEKTIHEGICAVNLNVDYCKVLNNTIITKEGHGLGIYADYYTIKARSCYSTIQNNTKADKKDSVYNVLKHYFSFSNALSSKSSSFSIYL